MTIALLEKENRNKSRDGSSVKKKLVWSDGQQEKMGADQASGEDASWNETKVSKTSYKKLVLWKERFILVGADKDLA